MQPPDRMPADDDDGGGGDALADSGASRVASLVEEAIATGLSPEEVCAACPGLTREVRAQWERCRAVQAELDNLFPPSSSGLSLGDERTGEFAGTPP